MKRFLLGLVFALLASPAFAQLPVCNNGDMIYRGSSGYQCVPFDNTAGKFLQGQGAAAAPIWSNQASQAFRLPTQTTNSFLGNTTGGTASPTPNTVSQILDTIGYDIARPPAPGAIIYKSQVAPNNAWQTLAPSVNMGAILTSGGLANPPYWALTPTQANLDSLCTTQGAVLYRSGTQWVCLLPGTAGYLLQTAGPSANPAWVASSSLGTALTKTDDTNVTLTLGGASTTALVNPASLTLGWTGTLGAGRLNSNVVQTFTNDTNITASITAQNATLTWAGTLAIGRGGTGQSTAAAAISALMPTPTRAGDVAYWNGANWVVLAGNNSGTNVLTENTSGVPSWGPGGAPSQPQGRLTLTTGVAVMSASVAGATQLFYTPSVGRHMPIWNGTNFAMVDTGGELSQLTTDAVKSPAAVAASQIYDFFGWQDSSTVTVTIASPAVVTWTGNGFAAGAPFICSTTGALPTNMSAGTLYYVISAGLGANSFEFATSAGGAAVNTSGSQSGTHTCTTVRVTRGPPWATGGGSATTRGTGAGSTALVTASAAASGGLLVNANAITNGPTTGAGTYLGTCASDASSQLNMVFGGAANGGTAANFGCWNQYNQAPMRALVQDNGGGADWTYTSATIHSVNGSNSNRISWTTGALANASSFDYHVATTTAAVSGAFCSAGFVLDATNTIDRNGLFQAGSAVAVFQQLNSSGTYGPVLGNHFVQAVEFADGTHACTFTHAATNTGQGLEGILWQ